jgi:3-hydroxy-9,10-secoandrosta-1,3,5(10)-triene-9,17-dione monooxygenase reductase component
MKRHGSVPEPFVETYLSYLLTRAAHRVSEEFHAELPRFGLSVAEWRTLACLYDSPGLGVSELAAMAIMKQPSMTKVLDRLQAQGLILREAVDGDRRRVRARLTPAGRARVKPAIAAARAHQARVLAPLSDAERALITRALDLIAADQAPVKRGGRLSRKAA